MIADKWLKSHYKAEFFSPSKDFFNQFALKYIYKISGPKVITIGGTNGKGQTSRCLAQILKKKNKSFCLWTSPHLKSVVERFSYEQGQIPQEDLVEIFQRVSADLNGQNISYYEFLFLCFLEFASIQRPEFIILEVGLGGRLDAVNLIDCDLAAIVSVSRDHQEFLGNSLQKILIEKLAIARSGKKIVTSFEMEYLRNCTQKYCDGLSIKHIDLFSEGVLLKSDEFNLRNFILSYTLYSRATGERPLSRDELIQISEDFKLNQAEKSVVVHNNYILELKGTHNVDGMRKLVQFLYEDLYNKKKEQVYENLLVSFSQRDEKDIESMVKILMIYPCLFKKITLVAGSFHKACEKSVVQKIARKFGLDYTQSWQKHFEEPGQNQKVLLTGSNYFIGEVLSHINSL